MDVSLKWSGGSGAYQMTPSVPIWKVRSDSNQRRHYRRVPAASRWFNIAPLTIGVGMAAQLKIERGSANQHIRSNTGSCAVSNIRVKEFVCCSLH